MKAPQSPKYGAYVTGHRPGCCALRTATKSAESYCGSATAVTRPLSVPNRRA
jgi:hypothetical protein